MLFEGSFGSEVVATFLQVKRLELGVAFRLLAAPYGRLSGLNFNVLFPENDIQTILISYSTNNIHLLNLGIFLLNFKGHGCGHLSALYALHSTYRVSTRRAAPLQSRLIHWIRSWTQMGYRYCVIRHRSLHRANYSTYPNTNAHSTIPRRIRRYQDEHDESHSHDPT
jgi:hypothetical protein